MMNTPEILIIEDENAMARLLATVMHTGRYNYHVARNGRDGLSMAMSYKPDVILTDLGLPDMDGMELIENIRSWSNVPIIVVSSRKEDSDKVAALDLGADDYVVKPFSIDELMARIRVALRHLRQQAVSPGSEEIEYTNGQLRIDYAAGCAYVGDKQVHFTPIEYRILCAFARNTGRVLTHNIILKEVWGTPDQSELPSLRVFVTNIRKKLVSAGMGNIIETHIGVGYRMLRSEQ